MKKNSKIFLMYFSLFLCVLLIPQYGAAAVNAKDLSVKISSGEYQKKIDNFLIIFDASSSMFLDYQKEMKLKQAKRLVSSMNQTIPDLDLQAGIRIFGPINLASDSKLQYGMTKYTKAGITDTMASIITTGGGTPQSKSIRVAIKDLAGTRGKTALVIISDADDVGKTSVQAAQTMKKQYGDKVCIYTILIGDNARAKIVMSQIAAAGGCGFATDYAALNSPAGMADFVEKVFMEKVPDSDGDGVLDPADKCPNTPRGTVVDAVGCPKKIDSDGDGVYDDYDRCPGTPKGIMVDKYGCPKPIPAKQTVSIELHMMFSFDKSSIRPRYNKDLKEFAEFLATYKDVNVLLEGHTDNLGPVQYNLDLSLKRAESVKKYLVETYRINPSRLATKGYGSAQPVTANDTRMGRQRNRRVSAVVSAAK